MKHMGMLDFAVDPVMPGGLAESDRASLLANGWTKEVTAAEVKDAYLTFADPELPGGVAVRRVSIPAGTVYFKNTAKNAVVVDGCGNLGGLWGD